MENIGDINKGNALLKKDFNTKNILDLLQQVSDQAAANALQAGKN